MANTAGGKSGSGLLTGSRTPASEVRPAERVSAGGRVPTGQPTQSRLAYAGARLLLTADAPARLRVEELEAFVDWQGTWALRRRLAAQGLALAEALDLAQREAIGWPVMQRLVAEHATQVPGPAFLAGVIADHLPLGRLVDELVEGIAHQANAVEEAGGVPVILPMRLLARRRATEAEYVEVFAAILERVNGPLLIDWTGPARMALLEGCFPGKSFERVMALDPAKIRGARLSWLDARTVVRLRHVLLEHDQILFTGDDPLFARWILGGNPGASQPEVGAQGSSTEFAGATPALGEFSHAALDLLEAGGTAFQSALEPLGNADAVGFQTAITPLENLMRWILAEPKRLHPALSFLSWLDGRQSDARFVGDWNAPTLGMVESRRLHDLAAEAGLFSDPQEAWKRFQAGG